MNNNLRITRKYRGLAAKYTNYFLVLSWKLGMGKLFSYFPMLFGKTMVVDFSGHGSKVPAQIPLIYFSQGELLYCTAVWNAQPGWFLHVIANPQVEVWLPEGWYTGKAELVEDEEERAQMLPKVLQNSGLAVSALVKLESRVIADEDLTADVQLLRIKRQSPCTGAEGPGSLAWLWPFFFFLMLFRSRRKKK